MEDDANTTPTDEAVVPSGEEGTQEALEAAQNAPEATGDTESTSDSDEPSADDVEALKDKIRRTNAEAMNLRSRLRETEDKLSKAQTPEDYEDVKSELANTRRQLLVRDIADEVGIPASFASRLAGSTEEELRADAEAIKADLKELASSQRAGRTPQTPTGGLDPSDSEEPFDAAAYAASLRANRF